MSDVSSEIRALEKRIAQLEEELFEVRQIAYGTRYSLKNSATHAGYQYNLLKPLALNSKIHWLAANYWSNHPLRWYMQDKYMFKYYISRLYGKEFTVPSLGVWDKGEYIDFDALPQHFVLKRTIGGGALQVRLVDKEKDNLSEVRRVASAWANDLVNAPARILAEPVLDFAGNYIVDFKVYVTRGKAQMVLVAAMDKTTGRRSRNFFSLDWRMFEIPGQKLETPVSRPDNLEEMIAFAEEAGRNVPLIRVDFYNFGSHFYIGELTTLPFNGYGPYGQFNRRWGDMVQIPTKEQIALDYEVALAPFPELRENPIFLKDRGPRHRLIIPNSSDGTLPVPPADFLQPNDPKVSIL